MSIEIRTEKVVNGNGEKERKILGWKCLPCNELPDMYIDNKPHIYSTLYETLVVISLEYEWHVSKDYIIPEEYFQKLLEVCVEAGNRLREINKHLAKLKAEWHGEETFII